MKYVAMVRASLPSFNDSFAVLFDRARGTLVADFCKGALIPAAKYQDILCGIDSDATDSHLAELVRGFCCAASDTFEVVDCIGAE